ncbi:hypothetical protein ACEWGB_11980, partial [Bifidobacterium longum subsp. infantis]
MGFDRALGVCDADADHLAHITESGVIYVSGFAKSDGDILLKGDIGQFSESYCARGATQAECVGRSIPSAYSYFSYYPFQSGPMLWYLIVFALFGTDNILAFQ